MPKITFIESNGTAHEVEAEVEMSLMEAATINMVPGIDGMCGGICSCATCHCYIPDDWKDKLPAMETGEEIMLETANHVTANSRLGCQVSITEDMDGITINLPEEQS